jgi:hypothetical protein
MNPLKKIILSLNRTVQKNIKHNTEVHINLTEGSRNAIKPVSPLINARINDIRAAAISIFTSKSSNCFKTNFQNGAPAFRN